MSDGIIHARVAGTILLAGSALGTVAVAVDGQSIYWVTPFLVGLVNGFLVTPDIDQNGTTTEESRFLLVPFIGRILFILFATYWYPYALLFKHRGWSHIPVFGTLSRFAYELLVNSLLFLLVEDQGIKDLVASVDPGPWLGVFLAGWMIQDFGHLLFDTQLVSKVAAKMTSRRSLRARRGKRGNTPPLKRVGAIQRR